MSSPSREAELHELLEVLCQGDLPPAQQARLQELVKADEGLRRLYVRYLHMHVCLRRAFEQAGGTPAPLFDPVAPPALLPGDDPEAPSVSPGLSGRQARPPGFRFDPPQPATRGARRSLRLVALAASVFLVAGLAWWLTPPGSQSSGESHVATLTNALGCAWDRPEPPAQGTKLPPGRLELNAGMAEITFAGGAVALVEAPALLDLVGPAKGFLHAGRVVIKVPPGASGFVMETAKARLLDIGTEFGVGVGQGGDTLVQVFDGIVVADFHDQPAGASQQRLTAGQTVQVGGSAGEKPRELASVDQRFVRRFPTPTNIHDPKWLVPYNRPKFDRVHVVPAPPGVRMDGTLTAWDRSGRFAVACEKPYAASYYVEGLMMYDRQHLYVGAHVGDPAPMCSVIDPATDPTMGWKAGAVQVRICTDRKAPWPVDAEGSIPRAGKPLRPQDRSDRLVHLTMWYYEPEKKPCLHIAYGMQFTGDRVNPPEVRAAFAKDADGRGYTMTYAIPWALLHAGDDPPRPGDELGCCWNVHWSDEDGRLWKGYLVDVLNPAEKGFTYQRAATWGRAIFHATGRLPPGAVTPR